MASLTQLATLVATVVLLSGVADSQYSAATSMDPYACLGDKGKALKKASVYDYYANARALKGAKKQQQWASATQLTPAEYALLQQYYTQQATAMGVGAQQYATSAQGQATSAKTRYEPMYTEQVQQQAQLSGYPSMYQQGAQRVSYTPIQSNADYSKMYPAETYDPRTVQQTYQQTYSQDCPSSYRTVQYQGAAMDGTDQYQTGAASADAQQYRVEYQDGTY